MDSFPISPSALPWWGWLLCAAGCWIVSTIAYIYSERDGCLPVIIAGISGLAGAICGLIGLIRFVKWVWGG